VKQLVFFVPPAMQCAPCCRQDIFPCRLAPRTNWGKPERLASGDEVACTDTRCDFQRAGLLSGPVNKTFFGAIARPLHAAAAARSNHCHTYSIFCSTNWTPKHTHKRIAAQQWYLNTPTSWHLTPGLYDFAGPRRIPASVSTAILEVM
jgi:hypothetical protein